MIPFSRAPRPSLALVNRAVLTTRRTPSWPPGLDLRGDAAAGGSDRRPSAPAGQRRLARDQDYAVGFPSVRARGSGRLPRRDGAPAASRRRSAGRSRAHEGGCAPQVMAPARPGETMRRCGPGRCGLARRGRLAEKVLAARARGLRLVEVRAIASARKMAPTHSGSREGDCPKRARLQSNAIHRYEFSGHGRAPHPPLSRGERNGPRTLDIRPWP